MWSFVWTALAFAMRAQADTTSTSSLPTKTVVVTQTVTVQTATVMLTSTVTSTATVTVPSGGNTVSTSSTLTSTSTTSTADSSAVTNQAYIDTILRHHNYHRLNHTSPNVEWDATLAETARKITTRCVFEQDLDEDCPSGDQDCYSQNAAAGYPADEMGGLISEGFYNPEANDYTYYGHEPDIDTYPDWGHMTTIIWKWTTKVGCYTADCSQNGLEFPENDGDGVPPYFTICNYAEPGNFYGAFKGNVLPPTGLPTILGGYDCPRYTNCLNGASTGDEGAAGDDGDDSGEEADGDIVSPDRKRKRKLQGRKIVRRSIREVS